MRDCSRRFATASPTSSGFNLVFSSFGNKENPLAAFSGLTLPAMTRMAGFYTHVTLHHLMDHIDLMMQACAIKRSSGRGETLPRACF